MLLSKPGKTFWKNFARLLESVSFWGKAGLAAASSGFTVDIDVAPFLTADVFANIHCPV